jgi:cell division protein ZapA
MMENKTDEVVVIAGKQYTISGNESREYLQRIAAHINDKLAELKTSQTVYDRLDTDTKNFMLIINLADDFCKLEDGKAKLQSEYDEREHELFEMKHELVNIRTDMEAMVEENRVLKLEKDKNSQELIKLQTEAEQTGKSQKKDASEKEKLEKEWNAEKQRHEAEKKQLNQALDILKQKLVEKETMDKSNKEKIDDLSKDLRSEKDKVKELYEKIAKIEVDKEMLQQRIKEYKKLENTKEKSESDQDEEDEEVNTGFVQEKIDLEVVSPEDAKEEEKPKASTKTTKKKSKSRRR